MSNPIRPLDARWLQDRYEEETCSQKKRDRQDEWWGICQDALGEGHNESEAKELADDAMYHKTVGDEAYHGVSRDD